MPALLVAGETIFRLMHPLSLDSWLLNPADAPVRIAIGVVSSGGALFLRYLVLGWD